MNDIEKRARDLLAAEVDRDTAAMPGIEEVATSIREGGDGNVLFVPTALRAIIAALTPPEGYVLVPAEPTAEILAAASVAVWPQASRADVQMAIKAATIVLSESMDLAPGITPEMLAASIATMAPAYRAMLAARPEVP